MPVGFTVTLIFLLSLVLIKSADGVIVSIRRLARGTGLGATTVAALLLALATSFPELFVGITSALNGTPALSLGNIIGANIANLSLVLGLAGFLAGAVHIRDGEFLHKELPMALFAGLAPIILLWDRALSRVDGLILLVLYGAYASGLFHKRFVEIGKVHQEESFWHRLFRKLETGEGHTRRELVRFFISVAILLVSADFIVRLSSGLAVQIGAPIFLVGLVVVAIGTTLPELAFSYRSIKDHAPSLLIGNALGSIIANATLVLGLVALIHPIKVVARREYLLAAATFVIVIFLFWLFTRSKHELSRWEALILFLVFLSFVMLEMSGFNPFDAAVKIFCSAGYC